MSGAKGLKFKGRNQSWNCGKTFGLGTLTRTQAKWHGSTTLKIVVQEKTLITL
jgi:hypothetical protein